MNSIVIRPLFVALVTVAAAVAASPAPTAKQKLACDTCQAWMLEIRKALEAVYCESRLSAWDTVFPPLFPPQGSFDLSNVSNIELTPKDVAVQLFLGSSVTFPLQLVRRGWLKLEEKFLPSSWASLGVEELMVESVISGGGVSSSATKEMDDTLFSPHTGRGRAARGEEPRAPEEPENILVKEAFLSAIGINGGGGAATKDEASTHDASSHPGPLQGFAMTGAVSVVNRYGWDPVNQHLMVQPPFKIGSVSRNPNKPRSKATDDKKGDGKSPSDPLIDDWVRQVFVEHDLGMMVGGDQPAEGEEQEEGTDLTPSQKGKQKEAVRRKLLNVYALAKLQTYLLYTWYRVKSSRETPFKGPLGQTGRCIKDWIIPTDVLVQELCVGPSAEAEENSDSATHHKVLDRSPDLVDARDVSFHMCPHLVIPASKAKEAAEKEAPNPTRLHMEKWLGYGGSLGLERLFHWLIA